MKEKISHHENSLKKSSWVKVNQEKGRETKEKRVMIKNNGRDELKIR